MGEGLRPCAQCGRDVPFPHKPHRLVTDWGSLPSAFPESRGSLKVTAGCSPQTPSAGPKHSRTTSPAVRVWSKLLWLWLLTVGGSESPRWTDPPESLCPMLRRLFPSLLLWVGDLCVGLSLHTPRGRELFSGNICPACQPPHLLEGDFPFLHLHFSYQSLRGFFSAT